MQQNRIYAIMLRHLVQLPQDVNQWASLLFWPCINIILFGLTGMWMRSTDSESALFALVAGVALWQFLVRVNFGVSLSFLQEVISQNVINLFSSPLTLAEWVCAIMLNGLILGTITYAFCISIVWALYGYNMLSLGLFIWYTTAQLFIAGSAIGFFGASLLMAWGTKVQALVFMVGITAAPLSGAFYPIDVLPQSVQYVAYALPLSHIFHGLFTYIQHHTWSIHNIIYATTLNILLITIALSCFTLTFYASKNRGFEHIDE